jgi:hypothetical protein
MNAERIALHRRLHLAISTGLLQEVSCNLRGITAEIKRERIFVRFYYDGPVSDRDRDSADTVIAEVQDQDNFPPPWQVDYDLVRLDAPEEMPGLDMWAFHRREPAT